jgi:hypothetical protein
LTCWMAKGARSAWCAGTTRCMAAPGDKAACSLSLPGSFASL